MCPRDLFGSWGWGRSAQNFTWNNGRRHSHGEAEPMEEADRTAQSQLSGGGLWVPFHVLSLTNCHLAGTLQGDSVCETGMSPASMTHWEGQRPAPQVPEPPDIAGKPQARSHHPETWVAPRRGLKNFPRAKHSKTPMLGQFR